MVTLEYVPAGLSTEQAELAARLNVYFYGEKNLLDAKIREILHETFSRIEEVPDIGILGELLSTTREPIVLWACSEKNYSVLEEMEKFYRVYPQLQVILISKDYSAEFVTACLNSGISGFLSYPFTLKEFQNILKNTLQKLLALEKIYLKSPKEKKNYKHFWLNHQLSIDQLTGLFNRYKLFEILSRQNEMALVLINIDNFAQFNLGYGFEFGDSVLRSVAEFIESRLPANSLGFRLQADEFAVLLDNPTPTQEIQVASEIHTNLPKLNLAVRDLAIKVSCSVGVAKGRGYELLRQASIALMEARNRGIGNLEVYKTNLPVEKKQKENLFWITKLKMAFETDSLFPVFQPILDNRTGKIYKYESLIRLRDKEKGTIYPAQFLDAAKIAGLLPLITGAVVEKSLPYLQGNNIHISINVTGQDFRGLFLVDYLKRKTKELDIHPSRITLEILEETETSLNQLINEQLIELRRFGFRVAIDDFGVSASNFSRITELKPNYIKIDGRFITGIHKNPDLQLIVSVIQQISRSIGAEVIAEFVANEADYEFIKKCGIEYSQGYFISEPLLEPKIY